MNEKCNKYEAYYVFRTEESFNEHLNSCLDCQKEHLKMQKVSSLVKEAAPLYFARQNKARLKKLVSCAALMLVCFVGVGIFQTGLYQSDDLSAENSFIYQMGCPVDEYGLLQI